MQIKSRQRKNLPSLGRLALPAMLTLAASFTPAASAFAASPSLKDELTVSGRFALPKAAPSLQQALSVNPKIDIDEETLKIISDTMKMPPEKLEPMLLEAFEKSLANYGYVEVKPVTDEDAKDTDLDSENDEDKPETDIVEAPAKPAITVKFETVEFQEKDDDTLSIVSLSMDGPQTCLKADTKANFLSLKRKDTQKGRKAFAFLGTIALSALLESNESSLYLSNDGLYYSTYGGAFLGGQLNEASVLNKVNYYGKQTAVGEGYPPKKGKRKAKKYAMKNAIRLNFARYISQIGTNCVN